MTVRELIEQLESRDPNMEVYIGMYQKYGSDDDDEEEYDY